SVLGRRACEVRKMNLGVLGAAKLIDCSGVPGELRGLDYLHSHYGRLSWKTVVEPAIKLSRSGFPVTQDLVEFMDSATRGTIDFFVKGPSWAVDFAPNGTRVGLGDTTTRKR